MHHCDDSRPIILIYDKISKYGRKEEFVCLINLWSKFSMVTRPSQVLEHLQENLFFTHLIGLKNTC